MDFFFNKCYVFFWRVDVKKYFVTGLVILLPLMLTLVVVGFIFNILTEPFLGLTKGILAHYNLLDTHFLFLTPDHLQTLASQILILIVLLIVTILLGMVGRWFSFTIYCVCGITSFTGFLL